MVDHTRALSFGAAANDYDRFRPSYPEEAVRWALDGLDDGAQVVDLAAGTGILSRVVRTIGHQVLPVEPDPGMRAQLDLTTPGLTSRAGSAESMPLPDASADAVLVGQAYHWFDKEAAHAEIARVLRPGGTFAPIWNIRDQQAASWMVELTRIADLRDNAPDLRKQVGGFGPAFGPVEVAQFVHRTLLTPDELLGMLHTRSYWLTASAEEQLEVDRNVLDLLARHPDLAGRETIEMPYRTVVYRARRR
ncbi:class I SAM-dependent methyltransferase [Micromonospora arborensis]|uniref:Class I SAM-dependent methyltransferase n=1 Tax=Micromonospora arborensis TaxID=2116518 RepID=A0A318NK23_9ACTN|nr:class I SAM-dependent methyltransferase [Micromonospora arborensis]PYC71160.1 class I SAM-dependent methyltransferase [Micromonospora arborensis]